MAGFYDEVEQVFTCGLDWKIGRNLDAFNDILRGGFGRHEQAFSNRTKIEKVRMAKESQLSLKGGMVELKKDGLPHLQSHHATQNIPKMYTPDRESIFHLS